MGVAFLGRLPLSVASAIASDAGSPPAAADGGAGRRLRRNWRPRLLGQLENRRLKHYKRKETIHAAYRRP